jgi:UDP-glucose:glycoprotein glucosyltransferase
VDVNPAWVVTSKVCIYDLDNLKLSSLTGSARVTGVQAEFELQHILIEGFARDMTQKMPPSGAQFILGTNSQPHVADTLVMANMGYFQLKANPGVWEMVLRPGRTDQVYSIESIGSEGWVPGGVKNDKRDVVIANFEGLVLYPRLVRNPGMERANIQDEVQEEGGIWNSIKST